MTAANQYHSNFNHQRQATLLLSLIHPPFSMVKIPFVVILSAILTLPAYSATILSNDGDTAIPSIRPSSSIISQLPDPESLSIKPPKSSSTPSGMSSIDRSKSKSIYDLSDSQFSNELSHELNTQSIDGSDKIQLPNAYTLVKRLNEQERVIASQQGQIEALEYKYQQQIEQLTARLEYLERLPSNSANNNAKTTRSPSQTFKPLSTKSPNENAPTTTSVSQPISMASGSNSRNTNKDLMIESTDPTDAYTRALQFYSDDDVDSAITQMKGFLLQNPTHQLSANAVYWLGEFHLKKQPADYTQATSYFKKVVDAFSDNPNNDKQSKSLFRLVQLSQLTNQNKKMQEYLQRLTLQYPNSKESQRAMELIQ